MRARLLLPALALTGVCVWLYQWAQPRPSTFSGLACVSDRYLVAPEGWEAEAREALGEDAERSKLRKPRRTWRLPPQAALPRGGSLSLVTFDGGGTCEADRRDPRVVVVGGPGRAQGAIRLPTTLKE